jgi:Subtilase family/Peptidase inhibitor I9
MRRSLASACALTVAALTGIGLTAGSAAAQQPPSAAGDEAQSVIVVLNDQLPGAPASKADSGNRRNRAKGTQDTVLSRLSGRTPSNVKHFTLGNAFSATVTNDQAAALAHDPAVAAVLPDSKVQLPQPSTTAGQSTGKPAAAAQGPAAANQLCPTDPAHPLLEPEALTSIRAASTDGSKSAADLATGAGVKVGFLADNMDPNFPDFIRPDGSHVFVDFKDFSGDGPNTTDGGAEAFGDASSIAAQGTVVHDLSKFVNQAHPLPPGCNIIVKGVAPGASLVGLNVFGSTATNSAVLQAIDYAVTVAHVDVLNESLGLNSYPDRSARNMFQVFNDMAVAAGVTVTTSTGDAGITSTIGPPATDPLVIAVGATTDNRLYAQTAYAASAFSNGKWLSDNISALSSSGITMDGRTIDLVAPGEGNWADCAPAYGECLNFQSPPQPTDLQSFGGTSESAPLTAGVAALIIQAYRGSHHGASPAPALVKRLITGTARDIGLPADEQGAGLLDARAAVEAAITAPGSTGAPAGVGSHIVLSDSQLTLEGAPGSTQTATVNVTNVGNRPTLVGTGARTFVGQSSARQTVAFNANTLPTFTYFNGATWAVKQVNFTVPPGADRLSARMAWQGNPAVVRLTLLAPDGTFVANSRPQGGAATANYANVDVRSPAAGRWTAVMYSVAGAAGYNGPILFDTSTQRIAPVGDASPDRVFLMPGQTKPVRVTLPTPASGGDTSYSITFRTTEGQRTTVSAIVRALLPTRSGSARFDGVITGGNARGVAPAQTFSYAFDVPRGKHDLDVGLTLSDPGTVADLVLIDPNGELADVNSNVFLTSPTTIGQGPTVQLFDANPLPGRWHLVLVVQNPVTGEEIEQPFHGTVGFDQVSVQARGLPDRGTLPSGQALTVPVTVRNTGIEPIGVGVNARTEDVQTIRAVPIQGTEQVTLPVDPATAPIYMVPPDTKRLTVATSSSVPAQVELQGSAAGFDLFGDLKRSQNGATTSVATVGERHGSVSKGIWFGALQEIGPFGPSGAPLGTGTFTAALRTNGFDRTVTSSTGDPFDFSVDPGGTGGTPVIIQPGQSATIQVIITPGHRGDVVAGHLNLVTVPLLPTGITALPFNGTGEVIATLPYSYRVG